MQNSCAIAMTIILSVCGRISAFDVHPTDQLIKLGQKVTIIGDELGVTIRHDFYCCGGVPQQFVEQKATESKAILETLAKVEDLQRLCLNDTAISNAEFTRLKNLSQLRSLLIAGTGINKSGIKHISTIQSLKRLGIGPLPLCDEELGNKPVDEEDVGFDDDDVACLASLPALEELSVSGPRLTVACLRPFQYVPSLRTLRVKSIGELTLEAIIPFQQVQELDLRYCTFKPNSLLALSKMPSLETVRAPQGPVTADEIATIVKLPKLRHLDIMKIILVDEQWTRVCQNKQLRYLAIYPKEVSSQKWALIGTLSNLETLDLALPFRPLAKRILAATPALDKLTVLSLNKAKLADEDIPAIIKHRSLKFLILSPEISKDGVETIRRALPATTISVQLPEPEDNQTD